MNCRLCDQNKYILTDWPYLEGYRICSDCRESITRLIHAFLLDDEAFGRSTEETALLKFEAHRRLFEKLDNV